MAFLEDSAACLYASFLEKDAIYLVILLMRDAVAAGSADHSYFLPVAQVPFGDPQLEPPYGDRKFDQ